jgi:hypothetical protein
MDNLIDNYGFKAQVTTFAMDLIKEKEIAKLIAESKIVVLKKQMRTVGKGRNDTFLRMQQVQCLDCQRSKAIQDINQLSDLVLELWSEEYSTDVDYKERAKQIIARPAVRTREAESKRRSSYKEMEMVLENIYSSLVT